MVTPNTIVKLYSGIPCDPTYQNVLQWDSVEEQNSFFANIVPVATYTDFQFLDGNRELRVKRNMENCYNINYVAYQNHRYGNKWFYAFVTGMEYAAPDCTKLFIEEDIWASWQFDLTFNKSFVERETVNNDTIGTNTVPEDLELGPYVATATTERPFTDLRLYIMVSELLDEVAELEHINPGNWGGLPNPCWVFDMGFNSNLNLTKLNAFIESYANKGKSDAIISIFLTGSIISGGDLAKEQFVGAARTLTITPRNNKLYTYPYCALAVNSTSNANVLRYELFTQSPPAFEIVKPAGVAPTFCMTPLKYEGMEYNIKYQTNCSGFPVLPWIKDYYQNWIAQNKAAQTIGVVQGVVGGAAAGLGVASFAGAGGVAGAAGAAGAVGAVGVAAAPVAAALALPLAITIGKTLSQMYQAQVMPDTLSGSASAADANAANGKIGFYTQCMAIRPEYARIIDDYFSMYGYAVHRVKEIELHSRTNWNYIKTIGCNVEGECPAPVLKGIKQMFDNGVTLWHNGSFNYGTLSNPIITS